VCAVVEVRGDATAPVNGVTVANLTIAHAAGTETVSFECKNAIILPRQARDKHRESTQKERGHFLAATFLEPYEVSSGGDWAIHRGAAVFVDGAHDVRIEGNHFDQVDGNGLFLSRHVRNCTVRLNAMTGEKTGFLRHLNLQVMLLPRQARDKHGKNSKKARFVADIGVEKCGKTPFLWSHGVDILY
jgi:hypothetical protein